MHFMPFVSEAQRRKFAELVKQGKISQKEFDKWNHETGKAKLPERVGKKKKSTF
jgi:hypothetical protein